MESTNAIVKLQTEVENEYWRAHKLFVTLGGGSAGSEGKSGERYKQDLIVARHLIAFIAAKVRALDANQRMMTLAKIMACIGNDIGFSLARCAIHEEMMKTSEDFGAI